MFFKIKELNIKGLNIQERSPWVLSAAVVEAASIVVVSSALAGK